MHFMQHQHPLTVNAFTNITSDMRQNIADIEMAGQVTFRVMRQGNQPLPISLTPGPCIAAKVSQGNTLGEVLLGMTGGQCICLVDRLKTRLPGDIANHLATIGNGLPTVLRPPKRLVLDLLNPIAKNWVKFDNRTRKYSHGFGQILGAYKFSRRWPCEPKLSLGITDYRYDRQTQALEIAQVCQLQRCQLMTIVATGRQLWKQVRAFKLLSSQPLLLKILNRFPPLICYGF